VEDKMSIAQIRGRAQWGLSVVASIALLGWGCAESADEGQGTLPIGGAGGASGVGATGGFGGVGGTGATGGTSGVGGTGATGGTGAVGGTGATGGAGGMGGVAGDVGVTGGMGGAGGEAGMAGVGGMGGEAGGTAGDGAGGTGGDPVNSCLFDGAVSWDADGPFTFEADSQGSVNMWIPNVPAGCKVPMVHLANGTGASCATYRASLERLASHGFIALCYESPNTGAGTQAIMAWEAALSAHGDIADMKFGSTGHSQGGQSAFCALRLAEEKWPEGVHAGLAMQPASGFGTACSGGSWASRYALIESPMFMFSGQGSDGLVSQRWVQDGFDALNDSIEAYHWAKAGGAHIPVPNGEEMQISIPWFRWKLLGDNEACKAFKAIRETDTSWDEAAVQNEEACK
jgi:hypothetical protein